jgi:hypothetical protein
MILPRLGIKTATVVSVMILLCALISPSALAQPTATEKMRLFLVADDESCGQARLTTRDASRADKCGDLSNPLQEPMHMAGQDYRSTEWPTGPMAPFVLDTSHPITGIITIDTYEGIGAGSAIVEAALIARIDGLGLPQVRLTPEL